MLQITVYLDEEFNEETGKVVKTNPYVVEMEHSLVSLSKWESEWEIPFLGDDEKTVEQIISYIRMIVLEENLPEVVFNRLVRDKDHLQTINSYIKKKMTATWFNEQKQVGVKPIVTAEIMYHWMITLGIPMECQHWHINRLLTLVKVCNEKNKTPEKNKKITADQVASRRELNAQRKAELNTTG